MTEPARSPTVEEIGPDRADDFGRVVAAAYGMPPSAAAAVGRLPGRAGWHCFAAIGEGEPLGGAALFVAEDAGWLGVAGTAPAHRRKGVQSALLAARIRRARELGASTVTTETGELAPDRPSNSYRNILRSGFELLYVRPNLIAPAHP